MLCKYCNSTISDQAVFCSNCGKKQEAVIEEEKRTTEHTNINEENIENEKVVEDSLEQENAEQENVAEDIKPKNKKSKRLIIWATLALVVVIGFIIFMLKIGINFEKEQNEVFSMPSLAIKRGHTYAIINDEMVQVSKARIEADFAVETASYILLLKEDNLHIYAKDDKKGYVSKNVKDFKISMDGENILLLNKDNKLFYGKVTNIKNLNNIAKDVEKFVASSDLETIYLKNKRSIKEIDKDGKENDFKKDNVLNFSMQGDRFLAYITRGKKNNNLNVYDLDLEKDVYKDSIDKINYTNLETTLVKEDGTILISLQNLYSDIKPNDQSIYIISPDKKEEINEKLIAIKGSKYQKHKYFSIPSPNDEEVILITANTIINLDNFNETFCDQALFAGKYLCNLRDDNTVEILDPISLKAISNLKLDLYENELVEFIYTISNDQVYVKTNLSFYYYTDDSYKDLKLHQNEILQMQKDIDNEVHFYIIDEDQIEYIDKDNKKLIYDGKDIMALNFSTMYNKEYLNKDNEAVILDRDKNLFSIKGKEVKLITDKVDDFYFVFKNGIVFLKDKKLYLYKNAKITELGDGFEFRNYIIRLNNWLKLNPFEV